MEKQMKVEVNELEDTEQIEELYQEFKVEMLRKFRAGEPANGSGEEMIEWIMSKTNLSKDSASMYCVNFMEVLMEDKTVDQEESRKEEICQ